MKFRYSVLFETRQLQKLELLHFLRNQPCFTATKKQLTQHLEFSATSVLQKLIDELLVDIHDAYAEHKVDLLVTDKTVALTQEHFISFDFMKHYYLENSCKFQLLDVFLQEKCATDYDYLTYLDISEKKFYQIRTELKEILAPHDIKIDHNKLVGPEASIRAYVFEVYFHFFHNQIFPFDKKYYDLAFYKIDKINYLFKIDLTSSQKLSVAYMLSITNLRLQHGHIIHDEREIFNFEQLLRDNSLGNAIYQQFKEDYDSAFLSPEQFLHETQAFVLFLYSTNVVPYHYAVDEFVLPIKNKILKLFDTVPSAYFAFYGVRMPEEIYNSFTDQMTAPILRYIFYHHQNYVPDEFLKLPEWQAQHPITSVFVLSLLNRFSKILPITQDCNTRQDMFEYMWLDTILITAGLFDPIKMLPAVNVYIDFSYAFDATNYVKRRLLSFKNVPVNIMQHWDAQKADFYFSDLSMESQSKDTHNIVSNNYQAFILPNEIREDTWSFISQQMINKVTTKFWAQQHY
ncbi:MAG: helix-turn-helix domain-containing protein [Lactobacillaceae bacterium]|jgi:hypothetical protein|nr:helix-turn-helix domain-containing protein [Lactobacillaceae bacterium]